MSVFPAVSFSNNCLFSVVAEEEIHFWSSTFNVVCKCILLCKVMCLKPKLFTASMFFSTTAYVNTELQDQLWLYSQYCLQEETFDQAQLVDGHRQQKVIHTSMLT